MVPDASQDPLILPSPPVPVATPPPTPDDAIGPLAPLWLRYIILIALWLTCLLAVGYVAYLTVQLGQHMEATAEKLANRLDQATQNTEHLRQEIVQMNTEQARRKAAVDSIVPLTAELAVLRAQLAELARIVESMKSQVPTNTADISRLQKSLDTLLQRYNDLVYKKKPTLPLLKPAP